jgi:hypothetical protein
MFYCTSHQPPATRAGPSVVWFLVLISDTDTFDRNHN